MCGEVKIMRNYLENLSIKNKMLTIILLVSLLTLGVGFSYIIINYIEKSELSLICKQIQFIHINSMEFLLNMVFFILNKNRIIRGDFLQVEILNVIQRHKVAGKGVTKPCYVTLDNGTNVYIKYPNNPEGDLVLLNEWISASI